MIKIKAAKAVRRGLKFKFYSKKVTHKEKLLKSWRFLDMGCNIHWKAVKKLVQILTEKELERKRNANCCWK